MKIGLPVEAHKHLRGDEENTCMVFAAMVFARSRIRKKDLKAGKSNLPHRGLVETSTSFLKVT